LSRPDLPHTEARAWVARVFTLVEDVVYIGLGLLLAASALVLLGSGALRFWHSVADGALATRITVLLDRVLLILLIVELLYTVQVSFREQTIVPEPFLIVGLMAAIRRVLILTAEFGEVRERESMLRDFVIELAGLTALILVLVHALVLLRKRGDPAVAERG
jgi:uncharacterized membrane protein (DUF373 family)